MQFAKVVKYNSRNRYSSLRNQILTPMYREKLCNKEYENKH